MAKQGSFEVDHEVRGEDMKLGAQEGGFYDSKVMDDTHDDDGRFPKRSGNWMTATAHIVTAVIGSGVLSLGWSIAQMGWAFGPLILFMFSAITWYTAALLCDAYRVGDPITGRRNYSYMMAVKSYLGPVNQFCCAFTQYVNLFATGIGYTVTGSLSLVAAKRAVCFHNNAEAAEAPCSFNNNAWMIFFGALQLLFSQIPDFGGLWWLSYLATIMSICYSTIGLGMSIGRATQSGHADYGTAWGTITANTPAMATWNVFVGLGSMAFAYSFSMILIEITDTVKQPPAESQVMRKATRTGILITTFFYMSVGCISYAAFGNASPGNLLASFGFFNPYWLVTTANVFVFIHLIGAYQVYMQPFMMFVEESLIMLFPRFTALRWEFVPVLPMYGPFPISPLKLVSRSTIVCVTTVVALILPFFNDLVGFIGAIGFWPLTVYFPLEMHIVAAKVPRWSSKWCWLQALSAFTFCISVAAAIGSIAYVKLDLETYSPFTSISSSIVNAAGPSSG